MIMFISLLMCFMGMAVVGDGLSTTESKVEV